MTIIRERLLGLAVDVLLRLSAPLFGAVTFTPNLDDSSERTRYNIDVHQKLAGTKVDEGINGEYIVPSKSEVIFYNSSQSFKVLENGDKATLVIRNQVGSFSIRRPLAANKDTYVEELGVFRFEPEI